MGRRMAVLIVGTVLGLCYVWLVPGFSVLIGGPDRSAIVHATRAAFAGPPGASSPEQVARIRPKGLCRRNGSDFVCAVELVMGARREPHVIRLRKDAAGIWQGVP